MAHRPRAWVANEAARPPLAIAGAAVFLIVIDVGFVAGFLLNVPIGWDSASYWNLDLSRLYDAATTSLVAPQGFRYSPAIAQALAPFGALPWPVFLVLYTVAQVGALLVMGRRRWWFLALLPPVLYELWIGNIHIFLGAAVVLGFRWPAFWSFVILTKVTPGVGVLWFAFRREWMALSVAAISTAVIALVSFVAAPSLWFAWKDALLAMAQLPATGSILYPPLVYRLPIAIVILWLGARSNRPWVVPVAAMLALPTIWDMSYAMLAAAVALWWRDPTGRTTAKDASTPPGVGSADTLAADRRHR